MLTALRATIVYLVAIWEYRFFWMSLVRADFKRRYRRSLLGVGWSMLSPLAMALVLCVVYQSVFQLSFSEFGPFLLSGLAFWSFFSTSALQGCSTFYANESYIRQEPAPLAIYPLRIVLSAGVHFLIALGTTLAFCAIFKGPPQLVALLSLIPTVLLLLLMGWSVAILTAFACAYFQDVQYLSEVCLQITMFLTPIMYPPEVLSQKGIAALLLYNPLAVMVDLVRQPLLKGQVPDLTQFGSAAGYVAGFWVLAWIVTARCERRVIFQL